MQFYNPTKWRFHHLVLKNACYFSTIIICQYYDNPLILYLSCEYYSNFYFYLHIDVTYFVKFFLVTLAISVAKYDLIHSKFSSCRETNYLNTDPSFRITKCICKRLRSPLKNTHFALFFFCSGKIVVPHRKSPNVYLKKYPFGVG